MDGGSSGARWVARGALATALIVAALALTGGSAMANDRSMEVVCVDRSTGAWRASMTFSSIDVHDGHPVVVTFGSAVATLAAPGADGSVTLSQGAGGDRASATWSWSIARNGVVEQAGSARFTRPAGCEGTPATEPPATQPPPMTQPPATQPPATEPPATVPSATPPPPATMPAPPGSGRPGVPASVPTPPRTTDRTGPLPNTGLSAVTISAAALAFIGLGVLARRWARRRADQLIGD
jgi:hypothetical protein